ncbi:MAG: sigma-70 family RNA polymerase sigma factor [Clostridia bacterium]|nr:sigma-70 family RNA polymerase sigma factor [Clostridia bacterium]
MEEIYRKYRQALVFDARNRLGDEHLAEDCVQETFLCLYEKMLRGVSFDDEGRLTAFLFRTNAIVAAKMKRELARDAHAEEKSDVQEDEPISIESLLLREELGEQLDEALRSIPLHHAVAAICRYGYDQPYAEVGGRLGKSPDTARKYAARGIKELKEKMK